MKKILSAAAAVVLAASLISCGDSGDTYTANADTVLSVGTPVVTGKAYPGVNYITWTPVANAKEYEVYRTVGGASEKVATVSGALEFADYADPTNSDFALVDGVNYEYTIFAVGANSSNVPSRLVYLATSTAKTTVKATVPAYGTDITAFTDKATKDYLAKIAAKTGVTAPALIDPTTFALSNYNVSLAYPVIPGYKYGVKLVNETKVAAGIEQKKATSFATNFKSTYTAQAYKSAFGAGKYTAYLTVAALSPLYPTTAVYALGELTIADIGEASQKTANVAATYSADGKNAYVTWTPAKLTATGKETPVANYNVYRASAADNYQTLTKVNSDTNKVAALVKESATTANNTYGATVSDVYGITDTIADNTIDYKYYVVHTNGTLYGAYSTSNNEATLSAFTLTATDAPVIRSIAIISTDKENIENTFKVVVRKNNEKQTLALAYVKLADVYNGETIKQTFEPSAFTAVALGNPNYDFSVEENTAYVKVPVGTYLFKLTATEAGKKAKDVYQVAVMTPAGGDVAVGSLRATKLADSDKSLIITDTSINADTVGLYSYKVVTVETSTVTAYSNNVTTTTTFGDAFALAKVTTDSDAKLKNNVALGTYAALKTYKVATNEAGASTYKTATTYVQKISKSTGKTGNVQAW